MSVEAKKFPYREVNYEEVISLLTMWGGDPTDKHFVGNFMELGGKPLLSNNFRTGIFMSRVSNKVIAELNVEKGHAGSLFMTGALIYAGVYQQLTLATELPVHEAAIASIIQMNGPDLIATTDQNLRTETGELYDLLRDRVLPLISRENELISVGMLGAGAIHALVTESDRISVDSAVLDAQFPGLNDLFTDFPPMEEY